MSELDEIMDGKYEMRGFRIEGDTIGFDTPQSHGWNLSPRDIETIIYTLQQELERYKNIIDKATKHIQENYSNEDGEIWHKGIEIILNILKGE